MVSYVFLSGAKVGQLLRNSAFSSRFLMDFGIFKLGNSEIAREPCYEGNSQISFPSTRDQISKFAPQPNLLNLVSN